MERVRAGDRDALGVLLHRYWVPLVRYASSLSDDPDLGEDVVQDAFVRVWKHRESWSPSGTVSAYLYQITRNLSLNARRDRRTREKWLDRERSSYATQRSPSTPAHDLEASHLRAALRSAIDSLPARRREVFILSRFHQLTHSEIAEAMGISPQTVANQMSSALAELRKALAGQTSAG